MEENPKTESKIESKTLGDGVEQVIELSRQPVDLYKILKFEGLVGSGGEAKAAIAGGLVLLNGNLETQKRKKIVSGDTIEFGGARYRLHCDARIESTKPVNVGTQGEELRTAEKAPQRRKKPPRPVRKKQAPKTAGRKAIGIKS